MALSRTNVGRRARVLSLEGHTSDNPYGLHAAENPWSVTEGMTGLGRGTREWSATTGASRRAERAVAAGLALILLLLAALAVGNAVAGKQSAQRLEHSGDLVEAY